LGPTLGFLRLGLGLGFRPTRMGTQKQIKNSVSTKTGNNQWFFPQENGEMLFFLVCIWIVLLFLGEYHQIFYMKIIEKKTLVIIVGISSFGFWIFSSWVFGVYFLQNPVVYSKLLKLGFSISICHSKLLKLVSPFH